MIDLERYGYLLIATNITWLKSSSGWYKLDCGQFSQSKFCETIASNWLCNLDNNLYQKKYIWKFDWPIADQRAAFQSHDLRRPIKD